MALSALSGWFALRSLDRMNVAATRIVGGELPASAADQLVQDSRLMIVGTLVVTILVGLGTALALARLIADPLTRLGMMAEQVSKGDLTADIKSQSRDEVGWLEHS